MRIVIRLSSTGGTVPGLIKHGRVACSRRALLQNHTSACARVGGFLAHWPRVCVCCTHVHIAHVKAGRMMNVRALTRGDTVHGSD